MLESLRRLLLLTAVVGRARYLLLGVSLFIVKFAIDWTVARALGRSWSPLNYLIWPDRESVLVLQLPAADRQFGLVMLAIALPFIWVGVALTLARLRDASLPLWLALLFFVPLVNLMFILGLCLMPSRPSGPAPAPGAAGPDRERIVHTSVAGLSSAVVFLLACAVSAGVTALYVYLSASVLRSYGFGVFVGAPFAQGFLAAALYGAPRRRTLAECQGVAVAALLLTGVVLVALAIDGLVCIVMAAPILAALAALGGMLGYAVQSRPLASDRGLPMIIGMLVALPALMTAESRIDRQPTLREARTEAIVNAPLERVWSCLIAFPPIAEPRDLLFRTGIAYPQRAEILGHGVGAVRHCVFSTGAFVEPIEVWDEPRCLAFRVSAQPPPMKELSPFDIHPPHLDGFLVSERGQFRLEPLPGGRTRLEGTTWYSNWMWPAAYWGAWSDFIIHRIHSRVLEHVRDVAESEPSR